MPDSALWAIAVGATLQVALACVSVLAPRRVGAEGFYRLSAMVQFAVTGAVACTGTWWALMPGGVACLFALAARTAPARRARHAHLASLIHADRNDRC
jgi:hypothetical protein